jgi:ribosomal protein S15P/S13E
MLDVAADYDRRFILTESAIGARIDEALQWFEKKRKDGDERKGLNLVSEKISEQFDYLSRRYLL